MVSIFISFKNILYYFKKHLPFLLIKDKNSLTISLIFYYTFLNIMEALCPPNPKEFDKTAFTFSSLPLFST